MSKYFSFFLFLRHLNSNLMPNIKLIDYSLAHNINYFISKFNTYSGIYVLKHVTCNLLNNAFPLKRGDLLKGKMCHKS